MAQERHQPEHQSDSELASELTPTHSEARVRRPGVSVPSDRSEGRISSRPTPTPFGPPATKPLRPSSNHPAVQTAAGLGPAETPRPGSVPPAPSFAPPPPQKPATSETKPKPAQPDFRAEGEELVPLPDVTQSLPSIPLAAMLPLRELAAPPPEGGGRTLVQIGAFVIVLAASVVSVLRYAGVLGVSPAPVAAEASSATPLPMAVEQPAPPLPRVAVAAPVARAAVPALPSAPPGAVPAQVAQDPVTAEVERIVASLAAAGQPPAARADALVDAADRALGRGEERLAETLLGRALKIDEKHPRAAYTLARVRFAQNNLEGAEGWVLVAIRERPRIAEYHSLYADILAKQGHSAHARRERHKARNLAR